MDIEAAADHKGSIHSIKAKAEANGIDEQDVPKLGHTDVLTQKFDSWSMLALAFCVLGTWSTFAQDLASGLQNGGPVNILWGLCLVFACNICVALSLGELLSAMPTALGQAYWVHRLVPTPFGRFMSYMCAWINTFGWWTITASQVGFMTNFLLGMKLMFEPDWAGASEGWVQFLVFLGVTLLFTVVNLVGCRRDKILPWFNNFVGVGFGTLFLVFILVLLICVGTKTGLTYQPASFVFGRWLKGADIGWPNGVVWFLGLIQAAYGLTAFDSVVHMVEEIDSPRKKGPRLIWLAVVFGAVTGFLFMVVCLFCIQDLSNILASSLPFIDLVQSVVGLEGGCALIALFVFNGLGQGVSIATTASRLTWGFARDGGLPWSQYFSHVDRTWAVPARALWLQGFLIALVGILYLFATTVLQAILSVSTIALTISYAMPIIALLIAGRDKLPPGGQFGLGRLGPVLNWVSVIYCSITTVFFFFPSGPDPAPADMNYAIAVFGVMLVVSIGFWFTNGRKTYLNTDDAAMRLELARRAEIESHEEVVVK